CRGRPSGALRGGARRSSRSRAHLQERRATEIHPTRCSMARSALHQQADDHADISTAGETAAQQLAAYACALRFEQLPASPIERAKHCLIDAVGCAIFGQRFPWSAMVLAEALASGEG